MPGVAALTAAALRSPLSARERGSVFVRTFSLWDVAFAERLVNVHEKGYPDTRAQAEGYNRYHAHHVEADCADGLEAAFARLTDDDGFERACRLCSKGGDLLCCEQSGCGGAFHVSCLRLGRVPKGKWRCAGCARAGVAAPRRTWKRPKAPAAAGGSAAAAPLAVDDILAEVSDLEEGEASPEELAGLAALFQSGYSSSSEEAPPPPPTRRRKQGKSKRRQ